MVTPSLIYREALDKMLQFNNQTELFYHNNASKKPYYYKWYLHNKETSFQNFPYQKEEDLK